MAFFTMPDRKYLLNSKKQKSSLQSLKKVEDVSSVEVRVEPEKTVKKTAKKK